MRNSFNRFGRDILLCLAIGSIFSIILLALGITIPTPFSTHNSTIPTNYTTIPANSIRIGNCIFPLKLYNNMTAPQIENATLICYK